MSDKTPILDDLMTDDQTAVELDKHIRTLKRWRDLGDGPPFTRIGRQIYYRRGAVRDWILSRESAA